MAYFLIGNNQYSVSLRYMLFPRLSGTRKDSHKNFRFYKRTCPMFQHSTLNRSRTLFKSTADKGQWGVRNLLSNGAGRSLGRSWQVVRQLTWLPGTASPQFNTRWWLRALAQQYQVKRYWPGTFHGAVTGARQIKAVPWRQMCETADSASALIWGSRDSMHVTS